MVGCSQHQAIEMPHIRLLQGGAQLTGLHLCHSSCNLLFLLHTGAFCGREKTLLRQPNLSSCGPSFHVSQIFFLFAGRSYLLILLNTSSTPEGHTSLLFIAEWLCQEHLIFSEIVRTSASVMLVSMETQQTRQQQDFSYNVKFTNFYIRQQILHHCAFVVLFDLA